MRSYRFGIQLLPALLTVTILFHGAEAHAALSVTNYGTDSGSCGSTASPCRSISQAIENAASGETIWVGAGVYGDLSGDGKFDAPGSEHATVFTQGYDYNACAVCIQKTVQIYSYNGAAVTTIRVGPNSITPTTVLISANKVVFGAKGHGFTITGGNVTGVVVDMETGGGTGGGVTVSANIDLNDTNGFAVDGPEGPFGEQLAECTEIHACPPPFGLVLSVWQPSNWKCRYGILR